MRNIIKMLFVWLFSVLFCNTVFAAWVYKYTSKWETDPMTTLTNIMNDANDGQYKIQETALDGVTNLQWNHPWQYKITNTLDYIINNVDPYMQWAIYIWLVAAVIVLIYLWFLLVTHGATKSWDFNSIMKRMVNVIIWVLLLTWFYAIIKIVVWLINMIFK
jgi:hypothetical protein